MFYFFLPIEMDEEKNLPCNPTMTLIASNACKLPMTPVTAPKIPVSSQLGAASEDGGLGKRQR